MKKNYLLFLILMFTLFFLTNSCGNVDGINISIPGVTGPNMQIDAENAFMTLTYQKYDVSEEKYEAIPKMDNSFFQLLPSEEGGTIVNLNINIDDLFDVSEENLDPQKLPGGRNIPGTANGSLPAISFSLDQFPDVRIYIGDRMLGLFIPLKKVGTRLQLLTYKYYINKNVAGTISLVGEDENDSNGGILLIINIKKEKWDKLVNKYRKSNIH